MNFKTSFNENKLKNSVKRNKKNKEIMMKVLKNEVGKFLNWLEIVVGCCFTYEEPALFFWG